MLSHILNLFGNLSFPIKKNKILWLTRWKAMASKSEQKIAADNGVTDPP